MVGISQDDLSLHHIRQVLLGEGFDAPHCTYRHEYGRLDNAVVCLYATRPCVGFGIAMLQRIT